MIELFNNVNQCFWFLLYIVVLFLTIEAKCPEKCLCKNNTDSSWNLRVKCGGNSDETLSSWLHINFEEDAVNVFSL